MAKIVNPKLFSQQFGVPKADIDNAGFLDPLLNADTKLFIDPLLLRKARTRPFEPRVSRPSASVLPTSLICFWLRRPTVDQPGQPPFDFLTSTSAGKPVWATEGRGPREAVVRMG